MVISDNHNVAQLIASFSHAWMTGQFAAIAPALNASTTLVSHQHGMQRGCAAITAALSKDTAAGQITGRTSNSFVAIDKNQAACSLYLFGSLNEPNNEPFQFGATLLFELKKTSLSDWCFEIIRLAINWTSGPAPDGLKYWGKLPQQQGWQFGDRPPVIVSELHSPWQRLPAASPPDELKVALQDLYNRYAFAVDQNDIALLATTYTEDVHGGFAPMGYLNGREAVIGMLKSFRHLAPFWQHFADVVKVERENAPQYARMIVARIIPQYPVDQNGNKIYGAHYQLRVRMEEDAQWRICWSDYRPGWFYADELPEFDIGNVQL